MLVYCIGFDEWLRLEVLFEMKFRKFLTIPRVKSIKTPAKSLLGDERRAAAGRSTGCWSGIMNCVMMRSRAAAGEADLVITPQIPADQQTWQPNQTKLYRWSVETWNRVLHFFSFCIPNRGSSPIEHSFTLQNEGKMYRNTASTSMFMDQHQLGEGDARFTKSRNEEGKCKRKIPNDKVLDSQAG